MWGIVVLVEYLGQLTMVVLHPVSLVLMYSLMGDHTINTYLYAMTIFCSYQLF